MLCRKCRKETPDESKYCILCGAKQDIKQNPKRRGNGQGSVYQLPNKSWIAIKVIGYKTVDGKIKKETRSKSGFKTKKEAINYLPNLSVSEKRQKIVKFKELYDSWLPTHRAGQSTINCYKAAIKYFEPIWLEDFKEITIEDLQECMDECPKGKRTKENMKTLCGLLYKYAIPRRLTDMINLGQYLVISAESSEKKEGLPIEAVQKVEENINQTPYADYVFCQCYLGFRPSEFLSIAVENYNKSERAFVGGAKTDAGKDRIVTVSPKIQPIIDKLIAGKITGPVFCASDGTKMSIGVYRSKFYAVLDACGIDNPVYEDNGANRHKYTPHSCRHTFATLMKRVPGASKDKLELIGHTSEEMLRHYQDVSYSDLRQITDAI
jgi:integrase